jgi:hypothetical protein
MKGLDDLQGLTKPGQKNHITAANTSEAVRYAKGERNRAVLLELHRIVWQKVSRGETVKEQALVDYGLAWSSLYCEEVAGDPVTRQEVQDAAQSVLGWLERGTLYTPAGMGAGQFAPTISMDLMDRLGADGSFLLRKLQAAHWDHENFKINVESFAASLRWDPRRLNTAIDLLRQEKQLNCLIEPKRRKSGTYSLITAKMQNNIIIHPSSFSSSLNGDLK